MLKRQLSTADSTEKCVFAQWNIRIMTEVMASEKQIQNTMETMSNIYLLLFGLVILKKGKHSLEMFMHFFWKGEGIEVPFERNTIEL